MNTDIKTFNPFTVRKSAATKVGKEESELLRYITDARNEWLEANMNFEHAYEEKLIDYYTYKMKACEARYTYFIKMAKEKGLKSVVSQYTGEIYPIGEFNSAN
jgi:hypothetical protein